MQNKKCYLCKNEKFIQRPGAVRNNDDLKVLECKECGLVFLSSFDHIDENYYADSQMHQNSNNNDYIDWLLHDTETDNQRRYEILNEKINHKDILDFGCGAGGFLLKARELAKTVVGIELEKCFIPYYKNNLLEVYESFEDLKENQDKKFDLITLFHVLEHIPEPIDLLKSLKPLIKKDGEIIIEVPNSNDALLSLYKNKAFSDFTYCDYHLYLFSQFTLLKICEKAGYKVNSIQYIQRYPLSNHLYWLSKNKPGGHKEWSFLDSMMLKECYEKQLASIQATDTIIAFLKVF